MRSMQERIEAHQMKTIKVGDLVVYVQRRSLRSGPSSVSVVQLLLPKVQYLCFPQAKDQKKDIYLIPEIFVNRVKLAGGDCWCLGYGRKVATDCSPNGIGDKPTTTKESQWCC